MAAEWAPQDRVWMAFPSGGYTLGPTEADAEAARAAWAAVAGAILPFAPVSMVVDPSAVEDARRHLDPRVEIVTAPLDDAWMRDIGPTFVHVHSKNSAVGTAGTTGDGAAAGGTGLAAVDWVFNGWGGQDWARWDRDRHIGAFVAEAAGVPRIASTLVNEGGGFHVDGEGTALATRSVQLDPGRNPGLTEADVEAEFARVLGVERVIWLDRGLHRDAQRFGTRGHVDIVAAFAAPGVVLVHDQTDPSHPDHEVTADVIATLSTARDAAGRRLEVIRVPAPQRLRDEEGWVDLSYLNHLIVNDGVIACAFDDPNDEVAAGILAAAHPHRTVVTVDAREIFARGGGIHCITQQQPSNQPVQQRAQEAR
ncbi:agmatine/peptidylarginine deiminase [Tersicoccus sp. Bi-70]|uniref:agmatine deiminase family protein n=1 Tax=Tersicoccus sp. Bi-70 TaxID=1897634 RepID=UPI000978A323|nr:agmatine deiminase family protein [Tersicoccus sp. Bi-70]OMH31597.1 agmatine deiminase [Tersicoccus sp. Bi-70]